MKAHELIPGVPAAGHLSARGYWHPGKVDGCVKCPSPKPTSPPPLGRGSQRFHDSN